MRAFPAITAALVILTGCGDARHAVGQVNVSEVDGVLEVHVASLTPSGVPQWQTREIFSTATVADPVELYSVTAARFVERDVLAVANSGTGEILTLDSGGALISRAGGKGRGPGEFEWISTLEVDTAGRVIAYDPWQGRLTTWSDDGEVLDTRRLSPPDRIVDILPLAFLHDGRIAAVYGEMRTFARSGEKRDTTPLMFFEGDGTNADTIGVWPATEWAYYAIADGAGRMRVGFGRTLFYAGRNARFAIGANDSLDVDVYDGSGAKAMHITGVRGSRVESGDVDRWRDDLLSRRLQASEEFKRALRDVPHRETYPAFGELVVDDEGRIWIGAYARPGQTEREWLVLGIDGTPQGRVTLPVTSRILDIAHGRIAVVNRDDLDEEYIAVLELERR